MAKQVLDLKTACVGFLRGGSDEKERKIEKLNKRLSDCVLEVKILGQIEENKVKITDGNSAGFLFLQDDFKYRSKLKLGTVIRIYLARRCLKLPNDTLLLDSSSYPVVLSPGDCQQLDSIVVIEERLTIKTLQTTWGEKLKNQPARYINETLRVKVAHIGALQFRVKSQEFLMTCVLADKTGEIEMNFWGGLTDILAKSGIQVGDVIDVTNFLYKVTQRYYRNSNSSDENIINNYQHILSYSGAPVETQIDKISDWKIAEDFKNVQAEFLAQEETWRGHILEFEDFHSFQSCPNCQFTVPRRWHGEHCPNKKCGLDLNLGGSGVQQKFGFTLIMLMKDNKKGTRKLKGWDNSVLQLRKEEEKRVKSGFKDDWTFLQYLRGKPAQFVVRVSRKGVLDQLLSMNLLRVEAGDGGITDGDEVLDDNSPVPKKKKKESKVKKKDLLEAVEHHAAEEENYSDDEHPYFSDENDIDLDIDDTLAELPPPSLKKN